MANGGGASEEAEYEMLADPIRVLINDLESLIQNYNNVLQENFNLRNEISFMRNEITQMRNIQDGDVSTREGEMPSKRLRFNEEGSSGISNCFKQSNKVGISSNTNSNINNNVARKQQKKKIIQVVNANINDINNKLKIIAGNNNYLIKQNNKKAPVKISIIHEEAMPQIKKALSEAKVSFHEFKWESEKKLGFFIRGLVGTQESDLEFIKSELIAAGLPDQISLSIFKSGYMRANPDAEHNTIIQLILPPNTDTQILKNIKHIDHMVIKIEPISNSSILQCKNCQRFGHSAGGCQHANRCVKCGLNHYKESCPRTTNKSIKLVCCNCGGEHTANNIKDCQVAQKFINDNSSSNQKTAQNIKNTKQHIRSSNNGNNPPGILKQRNTNQSSSSGLTSSSSFPSLHSSGQSGSSYNKFVSNMQGIPEQPARNSNISYADVLASNNITKSSECSCPVNGFNEIMQKLDVVIQLVLKHEQILSKLQLNG